MRYYQSIEDILSSMIVMRLEQFFTQITTVKSNSLNSKLQEVCSASEWVKTYSPSYSYSLLSS